MHEFSETLGTDEFCLPCQQANRFYLGQPPAGCPVPEISGAVNGLQTPLLKPDTLFPLLNTQPGTANELSLTINGLRRTICKDITQIGPIARPEDLQVAIGTATAPAASPPQVSPGTVTTPGGAPFVPPPRPVPIGRVSSARMPFQRGSVQAGHETGALDVMSDTAYQAAGGDLDAPLEVTAEEQMLTNVEAHPSLGPPPFDGEKAVDDLTAAEEEWLVRAALATLGPIDWVDQVTGAAYLREEMGVDLSLTGTNMPGVIVEALDILLTGDKRRFLKEMFGQKISKVWVNSRGTTLISFTGNTRLRGFVTGSVYGAANPKVSLIQTAVRTQSRLSAAAGAIASKAGVISIGFVTFVNVAEWLSEPASEREINDLIATLAWDLGAVAISLLAGAIAAAAAIAFAAIVGATAPVALIVSAGILAGVGIGLALDWLERSLDAKAAIKDALDNATAREISPVLYDEMMTAP